MRRRDFDPLYLMFEKHLFTALVDDETSDEFMNRVVTAYMGHLMSEGVVPGSMRATLESDLRDEVREMLLKKTYGHYNLASFRKANGVEVEEAPVVTRDAFSLNEKTRRGGRAC